MSQMDVKCKICDIWKWKKKHLFLDISSSNTDIFVPSLYQCVETRSIKVFWLLSQSFPHLRFIICGFQTSLKEFLNPVVNRFTRQTRPNVNKKHFFMNILCIESLCPQKYAQQNDALRYYTPQARSSLLPRLSWSWTVLLPSDTHRKPITSIAAVLLSFVTYLLTLPRTIPTVVWRN
jgi:hypothetical protein